MTFNRQPVAHLDRRRAIAEQIVDRHTEQEREAAWRAYIVRLGTMAKYHIKTRGSLPEQLAELLEPGVLERMVKADNA